MGFFVAVMGHSSDALVCHNFFSGICGLNTLVTGVFPLLCVQFGATLHCLYVVGIKGRLVTVSVFG
jgi:hypothetical protein